MNPPVPEKALAFQVKVALQEDVGSGDVTAGLVDAGARVTAELICRETAVLCGRPWFEAVFRSLDPEISFEWHAEDGQHVRPDRPVCSLQGSARAVLTGERTAMNFLQLLSGVATRTRKFVERIKGTNSKILDTRKTLPGLRSAQKYAVACGRGQPHRIGLYDAFLIKENHIAATGSLEAAIAAARAANPRKLPLMVEAENLQQVEVALDAAVDVLLLDNFATHLLSRAVNLGRSQRRYNRGHTLLEASGGITLENVREIADTGVDRISIGDLTKNVSAVDLSLRIQG